MNFLNNNSIDEIVNLASHENLSNLAYKKYGDTKLWRTIADANEEYDLFEVNSNGIKINVPSKDKAIAIFKSQFSDEIDSVENTVDTYIGKIGQLKHQVIDWIL